MAHRFRFNLNNQESVVVDGERAEVRESLITVVDERGRPLASFAESDVRVWWQVRDGASA